MLSDILSFESLISKETFLIAEFTFLSLFSLGKEQQPYVK